jgi:single-stranded DNA-binding protein
VSASVFEEKAHALVGLTKGSEVYIEGRLFLNAWTGRDGVERTGFSVCVDSIASARTVRPGKPKVQSRDTFDDPLRF